MCDQITIDLTDGPARYRIAYPLEAGITRVAGHTQHAVDQAFACPSSDTGAPFVDGVATFVWLRRVATPTDRLLVAALIAHAERTVAWQRSELQARVAEQRADNLDIALQSSRRIGAALGILMTQLRITETQAFELLRTVSQRTHRKLRDIAEDVCETGTIDTCAGPVSNQAGQAPLLVDPQADNTAVARLPQRALPPHLRPVTVGIRDRRFTDGALSVPPANK